jgi:uncharacterized protein YqgC (DUF456 family)
MIVYNIVQILCLVIMLAGWLGLLIPGVPGLVIVWGASLGSALLSGASFNWVNIVLLVVSTGLMIFGGLVDNLIMGAAAANKGANIWLILGALAVGVVASLFLTPIGGLLAIFISLFVFEYLRLRDWRKALESTGGMAAGYGGAVAARLGIGLVMIALWGVWLLWLPH